MHDFACRLMRLKLTDSKLTCIAAEFKPVPQLSEDLPPGTKVCCTNASVKLGVLLLDAKSVQVTSCFSRQNLGHCFCEAIRAVRYQFSSGALFAFLNATLGMRPPYAKAK